jgi:hypothetical protein
MEFVTGFMIQVKVEKNDFHICTYSYFCMNAYFTVVTRVGKLFNHKKFIVFTYVKTLLCFPSKIRWRIKLLLIPHNCQMKILLRVCLSTFVYLLKKHQTNKKTRFWSCCFLFVTLLVSMYFFYFPTHECLHMYMWAQVPVFFSPLWPKTLWKDKYSTY